MEHYVTRGSSRGWPHDWRDPQFYARLGGIDRAGLMWEWLRRDADYIAWHTRASSATRGVDAGSAIDSDPTQWGLHFRRASGSRGTRGPDHLACRSRSCHARRGRPDRKSVG